MLGLPLTFAAPLVLAALVALPAIWFLLRVTPPQPRRIDFPPLKILADLLPERETPSRTPWWLLALRLAIAGLLILAAAGPVWNPLAPGGKGPLLLVLDNGFSAAHDWRDRIAFAAERIEAAERDGRIVALLPTAEKPGEITATAPASALTRLRALKPQPYLADRSPHLPALTRFIETNQGADLIWISDRLAGPDESRFPAELARLAGAASISVVTPERAGTLAIAGLNNAAGGLSVRLVRPEPNGRDRGTVRALDLKGLPLADAPFTFPADATETEARFDLPVELRNGIARVEILSESSAGAVALVDERGKRRRVGMLFGGSVDQAQPLLAPTYYLTRALAPYADVREGRGGVADAITQLLDEQVSVLMLADIGTLDRDTLAKVTRFVEKGGLLVRFAGSRLAAGNDDLVPVRLRRGGRNLGGALSWEAPKTLAPFTRESPFYGLAIPADLGVRRQILAEPEGDLARKTWASLADGTPIVTADKRGDGLIVLFHVTADTTWSNLPLTGLFVDMLRRVVGLAGNAAPAGDGTTQQSQVQMLAPQRTLDGFGALQAPPATARPIPSSFAERGSLDHPPGYYGPRESNVAVNALVAGDTLAPLDLAPLAARIAPLKLADTIDIRGPLLTLAILLLLLDTAISLWLGGYLARLSGLWRRGATAGALLLAGLVALTHPGPARAAEADAGATGWQAALTTRLAYVVTGDAETDTASKAGLVGLTQVLSDRTALSAGDPVGVDPARDELAFYPLIYFAIAPSRPLPSEAAIRRLDTFMKAGGTVIFDTRDALTARPGGPPTQAGQYLRDMLATLDIPELEPIPPDHVLTKTFYLLDNFPGRYANGRTWVEALPPASEGEHRPARAGDNVSPIIITGNDLAAAWAVGRRGEALYPVQGSDPRQREMALRAGVNIVMYTLTGNYKADQVHVPALLERLGQ